MRVHEHNSNAWLNLFCCSDGEAGSSRGIKCEQFTMQELQGKTNKALMVRYSINILMLSTCCWMLCTEAAEHASMMPTSFASTSLLICLITLPLASLLSRFDAGVVATCSYQDILTSPVWCCRICSKTRGSPPRAKRRIWSNASWTFSRGKHLLHVHYEHSCTSAAKH